STWIGLMSGLQDFHIINCIAIVSSLVKAAATVLLLLAGYRLLSLVVVGLTISVVGWIVNIIWVKRRLPNLKIRNSFLNLRETADIFRFSGAMFIWGIAGKVLLESDRIIIGIFLPITSVSIYEIGLRISNYSRSVLYSVFTVLPTASDLHAREQKAQLKELYVMGTKYLLVPYACVVASLLLFGGQFIYLWVGPGFEKSVAVMWVLLLGNFYQSQNMVAHVLLPGMGKIRVFTIVMAAYPVINL